MERGQAAAVREVPAGAADNDEILNQQRGRADITTALRRILHPNAPNLTAGLLIDRENAVVHGPDENQPVTDRDASVLSEVGGRDRVLLVIFVLPNDFSRRRVERVDEVRSRGNVHHPVNNDWGGLQPALIVAGLKSPYRDHLLDVVGVDLLQAAVTPRTVVSAVGRPVRSGPLCGDLRRLAERE